jgi:predicted dehydrogenase
MMNKTLKLGFIGGSTASAVGYTHFAACRMDGRWDLQAGCFSKREEQNRKSAQTYGVDGGRVYATWEEMLGKEKGSLDAVSVILPTPQHFETVSKCLAAGMPVICEKSLATDYGEAKAISEICAENKGFLAVTYNYSGYPMVRELRRMIRDKALGRILHFQVEMPQESFIRVNEKGEKVVPQSWRLKDGKVPMMYLDLGSHLHHLIHYLIGERPLEVSALHSGNGWFADIVDNASCLCVYSGGIQGQIWFSKSALGYRNGLRIRIFGSEGSAEWTQGYPEELSFASNDGTKRTIDRGGSVAVAGQQRYSRFKSGHPAGFVEAFANLYCDIADALLMYQETGAWTSDEVFGAELECEGLQFLEAMAASAVSKKWEKV